MSKKKHILFVDDEPKILDGFRRAFRTNRHKWKMSFAESGKMALDIMDNKSFDVIVSDMRMPGMSGADLLREVIQKYPQTVRIILSGQSAVDTIFSTIGPTHQYLSKPCDLETLKTTVEQVCAFQELLPDDKIKRFVSRIESFPSHPAIYNEIIEELQSSDPSINKVGRILSKDIGMSARILQLIYSAYFGFPHHVSGPLQAAIYLGLETVKKLVLSVHIFSQFSEESLKDLSLGSIYDHSVKVGALAKQISLEQNSDQKSVDNAYIGGLLHDIGKLILANLFPGKYKEAVNYIKNGEGDICEIEREVVGASHTDVGAYLLGLWGFPEPVMKGVAFHHNPRKSMTTSYNALTAVHVANVLESENSGLSQIHRNQEINSVYITELGLVEKLSFWREISKKTNFTEENI